MNKIVEAEFLSDNIKKFVIEAPQIAEKRKAGQFVVVRISKTGERIPITIANSDIEKGTITIVVQGAGKTTNQILQLEAGDTILDVVGPLGKPTHIENYGNCVVLGGGVGTAIAFPTAKALKKAGNYVSVILGAKTSSHIILRDEISEFADEVYITTDDGTEGLKGLITVKLKDLIMEGKIDFVLAIGSIPMMAAVADLTRTYGIKTVVSLNPIMLDGTGMCGGCRARVGGKNVFVCVDGPEFDAHEVDFNVLKQRNEIYKDKEQLSLHQCNIEKQAVLLEKQQSGD
ncbi:MAG: sulfide/dihydroorotate dehydrogenase-like FAD/NAD-binding protein [Bacteroidetes bacterium]|nr:sulfide/dihydroorotate dehydrogenase-like FAD/NAD-binding protein [Bacteroidota bacterium]